MTSPSPRAALDYMQAVSRRLEAISRDQADAILEVAGWCREALRTDGMIYLFGTGHSHMLAEEGHHRAGGLASVCPILCSSLMMHESVATSSALERLRGVAATVLGRYALRTGDVLLVFSHSGVNAVPVEAALHAKELGLKVVAVTSLAYAAQASRNALGKTLPEVADIVIDSHAPPGDALVAMDSSELRTGPLSTIAGAFILNAVLTEVVALLAADGGTPPVYVSSNIPGAAEHNARLVATYKTRNPHL